MKAIVNQNAAGIVRLTSMDSDSMGSNSSRLGDTFAKSRPSSDSVVPARVVFLTHYIPLYQVQVLQAIASQVREFHVLISTPIEPNRSFDLDWGGLNVSVQKTVTVRRRWRHQGGNATSRFVDPLFVHLPYDTNKRLSELSPDIVMSLELGARSLGAIRYCQRHPEAQSVLCTYMSEYTETHRGWGREKLRRYLIGRADAVTFNGPSCKKYLESLGAGSDQLYRLAYSADDRTACRGETGRDESSVRHRILYVGQLTERKGVLPMLMQMSAYCDRHSDREIELRIAGEGPARKSIEAFTTPPNLKVTLLGNVPATELSQEMQRCGVTVAPTLADEWLLVVNEALHAGLPVIGSVYAQATTTLIRNGQNGWQYDPTNETALSGALDQYFQTSDSELSAMRDRCRKSIAHCTPQWAAEGAVNAIRDLMTRRQSSSRSDK